MTIFLFSNFRRGSIITLFVTCLLGFATLFAPWAGGGVAAQTGTFVFTAEGDIGGNSNSSASLNKVAQAGGVFSLAVGDLGYVSSGGEGAWCTFVKNIVGSTFPFELLAGNHEDDSRVNGFIGNYTPCLPDRMSSTGAYGAEYYFDYNTARIIMAAAGSSVNGVNYDYNPTGPHRTWMIDRIREAKTAGKWVIVAVHKNCITPGTKNCEIGESFMDLMHTEGVDLFLQGHDHIYARTKQLSCANSGTYTASCVVDSDDSYVRGAGTVTVMTGITGQSQYNINASDNERNYFVKAMGGNGNWNFVTGATNSGREYGITKVTVAADRIDVVWVPSAVSVAGFPGDSFSIIGGPTPTPCGSCPTNTPTPTATRTNTPAPSTNVIQNPGFETQGASSADAANWTEGTNHARASDKFNTGSWSLKSTFRSVGTNTQQTASVVASTAYTYSGYVWRTNTVGGACMDMNDIIGELQQCVTTAGSWQFKSGTWNSGSNTSVTVRLITDGSPTGDIWFDDISLTGPGAGPTNTPTNTSVPPSNTPTRTNTPTGPTNTPTNTNTPAAPTNTPTNTTVAPTNTPTNTPVPSGNVVQNPGFETAGAGGAGDAANWTEGTNHARASDKFNTGSWSLKSTFRAGGTDTRQTVTTTTNKTYTYSGYIWRTNTVGGACMDMNDIAGELTLCVTTAGSWQFKTGTWNSGSNTSVTLRLITDASPTGDIWFDDISLQ